MKTMDTTNSRTVDRYDRDWLVGRQIRAPDTLKIQICLKFNAVWSLM